MVDRKELNDLAFKRDQQRKLHEEAALDAKVLVSLKNEATQLELKTKSLAAEQEVAERSVASAKAVLAEIAQNMSEARAKVAALNSARAVAVAENNALAIRKEGLLADIGKWTAKAQEIQANYELIAAVREARISISTLLWQKLLAVTETYFSLFREKQSTLSMSDKGILVDGHASAPSGSTLDVLGLALRLAMSKMFANSGLCILDEPSAGCDDSRTSAMTGGLTAAGFDQIIMVTHKDVDENAGNLIII